MEGGQRRKGEGREGKEWEEEKEGGEEGWKEGRSDIKEKEGGKEEKKSSRRRKGGKGRYREEAESGLEASPRLASRKELQSLLPRARTSFFNGRGRS